MRNPNAFRMTKGETALYVQMKRSLPNRYAVIEGMTAQEPPAASPKQTVKIRMTARFAGINNKNSAPIWNKNQNPCHEDRADFVAKPAPKVFGNGAKKGCKTHQSHGGERFYADIGKAQFQLTENTAVYLDMDIRPSFRRCQRQYLNKQMVQPVPGQGFRHLQYRQFAGGRGPSFSLNDFDTIHEC